jgi:hypothetical protein
MQSLKTRVPKNIVQRAEEIYPLLKEGMVSVISLCISNVIVFPTGFKRLEKLFYNNIAVIFILQVYSSVRMAVHIKRVYCIHILALSYCKQK